ncbi:hypothetical protein ACFSTH_01485 [Paenibacillus yanchengensis]|uniref:DUF4179 domain-containing protein n=1 Tax=Paenibacillus yanchengensis TaxID=2035833 RepID=A0ABW4YQM6_9BACL
MEEFDHEKQQIYNMLSHITVDSSKLTDQVKSRLREEGVQRTALHRRRWTKPAIAAVMLAVVLVMGTAAVALGNFDWFLERFKPSFGEIIAPVQVSSENQGIEMEVIGARKYDNKAIVYLSLQDITGQKRLTEQTDFRDGFSVKVGQPTKNASTVGNETGTSSISWQKKVLYFNEETNKIYYEFQITSASNSPLQDPLELGSFLIYFDQTDYIDEPIDLSLAAIGKTESTPIEEKHIRGGMNMPDDRSSIKEALTPGNYVAMPHGAKEQWVSNIGIIDGKLHVQIGTIFNKEFGPSDAALMLKSSDGSTIDPDYSLVLYSDEKNNLLDFEKNDYTDVVYKYEEFIFTINREDLNKYTLSYTGSVYAGAEGSWQVASSVSDTDNLVTLENDIAIEGYLFEYITLSPLGVQVIGSYERADDSVFDMILAVETKNGLIELEDAGGSQNSENQTFEANWNTKQPLVVGEATALIVNGTRIVVE